MKTKRLEDHWAGYVGSVYRMSEPPEAIKRHLRMAYYAGAVVVMGAVDDIIDAATVSPEEAEIAMQELRDQLTNFIEEG